MAIHINNAQKHFPIDFEESCQLLFIIDVYPCLNFDIFHF